MGLLSPQLSNRGSFKIPPVKSIRPLSGGYTFTYTGSAPRTYIDSEGVLQVETDNTKPIHETLNGKRAIRLEPQGVNLLESPRNLDEWDITASPVVTSAVGLDGNERNIEVTDNASGAHEYVYKGIDISADTTQYTYTTHIPKTTGSPTYYPALRLAFTGGTPFSSGIFFNTTTGAYNTYGEVPDRVKIVDLGDWWKISITKANTDNTTVNAVAQPAASTDGSNTNTAAVGTTIFDFNQIEAKKFSSSFVDASGPELTTNGDFADWTGDDPDSFTVGAEDANNYITEASGGNAARIVSDQSAAVYCRADYYLEEGATYEWSIDVQNYVSGDVRLLVKDPITPVDIIAVSA